MGRTFECDPLNPSQGMHRPALGNFPHEMMAVDATTGEVYMVEDAPGGRLYKFSPSNPGSVASGSLFAAVVTAGAVTWVRTSETVPDRSPATTAFAGGEGMWLQDRTLFFSTKGDVKVWKLDLATSTLTTLYDFSQQPSSPLNAVDNIVGHPVTKDLFVAEDGGNLELCRLNPTTGEASVFLRFAGHDASEVTGIAFSPTGSRLYVASQRGTDGVHGQLFEIVGPFAAIPPDMVIDGPLAPAERIGTATM